MEKFERDQQLPAPRADEAKLLESVRAEVATLQGRQDRAQHRLQELLRRSAATATARPAQPAR